MKAYLVRLVYRLFEGAMARAMPIALEQYNAIYSERWHPHHQLRERALADTVDYIEQHMANAMIMADEYAVLRYAAEHIEFDGLCMEFGVRTGSTLNFIAKRHAERRFHGFDSFEGLPEEWSGWIQEKGIFAMDGLPTVESNIELVVGRFDQSLPDFLTTNAGSVAFMHIDSDLYASAKTALDALHTRIRPGTIIVFNEYFNYPNWRQHEYRAFAEFCTTYGVRYEYLCWGKFEVAVRVTAIDGAPV